MKTLFITIISLLLTAGNALSQPQLMNYQGVARDRNGQVLSNKVISLKIHIISGDMQGQTEYSETHRIHTGNLGTFNIHIGAGEPVSGNFSDVQWSRMNHFVKIEMDIHGGRNFMDMGTTQLLSVPYAFHALTAGEIVPENDVTLRKAQPGITSQTWSLFGNLRTDPNKDKLGTTDSTDLVLATNNQRRLTISANGELGVSNSMVIGADLLVNKNVHLNTVDGETFVYGPFTVGNQSPALLTGMLTLKGAGQFDSGINIDATTVTDRLIVSLENDPGNSPRYGSIMDVRGVLYADSISTRGGLVIGGNLKVRGDSVIVDHNLLVKNNTTLKNLKVTDNVPDGGYLAVFENTNTGKGDGIQIKLGKARANNGLSVPSFDPGISTAQLNQMKQLIGCELNPNARLDILKDIVIEGIEADALVIGGLTVGIGNMLIDFINSKLKLPFNVVPEVTVFPGFSWSVDLGALGEPGFSIPSEKIGPFKIPDIPGISLSYLGIPEIKIDNLAFWGIPDICLTDAVGNPLNKDNEFIRFTDSSNRKMGSVRAQSVADWAADYLNPVYMLGLRGALMSTMDKKHAQYHFKGKISEAISSYTKIGVEYSSGNGDYAEWLERLNPGETITTGDIVGVTGGKISKDLTHAEQVMAVSHRPIVLGNIPDEGKMHLGNPVAFMGQIPVKIMGPVRTGDYIVGKGEIDGYGMAVSPQNMSPDDFKLAVGRAWESDLSAGPKMINTVVGIHNGDYIHILKRFEEKFRTTEQRLQALEDKILTGTLSQEK